MKRLCLLLFLLMPAAWAETPRPPSAAIASSHPLATAAGHEILARGGNAFDAAIAVAATLAVVEPYGSGLGGGGFWLLHREGQGCPTPLRGGEHRTAAERSDPQGRGEVEQRMEQLPGCAGAAEASFDVMVDGRERAPLAATERMYLDAAGKPIPRKSLDGALAAAIPGTPAALVHVAQKYGRLPLTQSLAPAISLAREGFAVTPAYRRLARLRIETLRASAPAAHLFLRRGEVPAENAILRQPELAEVLTRLAADGGQDFYHGDTARFLVAGVRAAGGIWTMKDLAQYRVVEREPVRVTYRGMRVTAAALPSAGGVMLAEMLNLLGAAASGDAERLARLRTTIEAMRLAYRDRARYLGDPDHVPVDVAHLLGPEHTRELLRELAAGPASAVPSAPARAAGENTTHFSILDRDGNRAAVTLSLNGPFGSGFVPPGTGVLLNNEMDDFAAAPDTPNLYGLTGSSANMIAPGKRPLSSMTPAFLETDDAVVALGTPGGSRIVSMVLLAALEVADGRGGPTDWVARPRFHHQYRPDRVEYEPEALTPDDVLALTALGYEVVPRAERYGDMQLVAWFKKAGKVEAASDPRGAGTAVVR